MKQSDFRMCAICGHGMATGVHFYRLKIDHMFLNRLAIQRQHGLEMMLGGSGALSSAFSLDEDLATSVSTSNLLVCGKCGIEESLPVAALLETADRMETAE